MRSLILALAIVTTSCFVSAQTIEINESKILIEKKLTPAWVVGIDEDSDVVRKIFISYMKDVYDLDTKKKSNKNVKVEQSVIPVVSDKAGDLWFVFNTKDDELKMGFAFFLGYDIAIESADYPDEMQGLKEFALEFIVYYKSEIINDRLTDNLNRLDDLNKSLIKLEKETKDDTKRIAKNEKTLLKETDDEKRFKLSNENIELKSRNIAISEIIEKTKLEMSLVSDSVKKLKTDLTRIQMQAIDHL